MSLTKNNLEQHVACGHLFIIYFLFGRAFTICHKNMGLHVTKKTPEPLPSNGRFLMPLKQMTFENIVAKEEMAHDEQFLLFPQCFL